MDTSEKLILRLFETNAIRVCPKNKPFWYTAATIGPYYINTHFLYGSEGKANSLLKAIDKEKNNIYECPFIILEMTKENYSKDAIYKGVIDEMLGFINKNIDKTKIDYISGGERRDWFFSLIIADMMNKPHITIYKNLDVVLSDKSKAVEIVDINNKKVLHIADLITEASSYERAWIPTIKRLGGLIEWSLVVIDRKQGGEEFLEDQGIKSYAMIKIDKSLFKKAEIMGLINNEQYKMIDEYIKNPHDAMMKFLEEHPEFMKYSLNSDKKTRERAKMCLEKNIYGKAKQGRKKI